MLMVLSPAKALNFDDAPRAPLTTPELKADIAELAQRTVRLRQSDLRRLMNLSEDLASLNRARFQAFDPAADDGLQAAFAFNGDVYKGLDARSLDRPALAWAQDHLRILSGLYGVLRPLDAIQPYRLEMGTRLKTRRGADLYRFWKRPVAEALNAALAGHSEPVLINLASQEYFAAVDRAALQAPVISCHFRESRDGQDRVISFYAKRARGLMVRFAVDGRIDRPEALKAFDAEGYKFDAAASTAADWIFTRPQPPLKSR